MVSKQFEGVTPERWISIKQVLHSDAHITISADEGNSESWGIEFSWHLGPDQILTVTITVPHFGWILHKAGFHTEEEVMEHFAAWINGVQ
jgi:hypothetical protein